MLVTFLCKNWNSRWLARAKKCQNIFAYLYDRKSIRFKSHLKFYNQSFRNQNLYLPTTKQTAVAAAVVALNSWNVCSIWRQSSHRRRSEEFNLKRGGGRVVPIDRGSVCTCAVYIWVLIRVCTYVYKCVYVPMFINSYMYVHKYVYVPMYMYAYKYVYVPMCINAYN